MKNLGDILFGSLPVLAAVTAMSMLAAHCDDKRYQSQIDELAQNFSDAIDACLNRFPYTLVGTNLAGDQIYSRSVVRTGTGEGTKIDIIQYVSGETCFANMSMKSGDGEILVMTGCPGEYDQVQPFVAITPDSPGTTVKLLLEETTAQLKEAANCTLDDKLLKKIEDMSDR